MLPPLRHPERSRRISAKRCSLFSFFVSSRAESRDPGSSPSCQWHLPSGESLPRALPKGQRVPTRRMRTLAPIQFHRLRPLSDSNSLSLYRERVRVRDLCAAQLPAAPHILDASRKTSIFALTRPQQLDLGAATLPRAVINRCYGLSAEE
jgi:hypothetical protein